MFEDLMKTRRLPATASNLAKTQEIEATLLSSGTLSIIVLGASGDLAKKKTFPAIATLGKNGLLPERTHVFGYARSDLGTSHIEECLGLTAADLDCLESVQYVRGPYDDLSSLVEPLQRVADETSGPANRLFYFALPPSLYAQVAQQVHDLVRSSTGFNRFVVEKPFGKDTQSFNELHEALSFLAEDDLYRIDHYLGKEMVQNLAILRFGNSIFEPLWGRQNVRAVVISFKEPFGVEGRGGYFDSYGIVRDVLQNHLLQVMSLFAMEPPVSLESNDMRDEKVKLLRAVPAIDPANCVLAQYAGYTEHDDVPSDSKTPTFASCVLYVNNGRWRDVPFILKAGKALNERKVEIRMQFHRNPIRLFGDDISDNELVVRLQPDEAIYMKVNTKVPGLLPKVSTVELDLSIKDRFEGRWIPDAYERLLYDVLRGEQSQFVRDDELTEAWRIFTPLLHHSESESAPKPVVYERGIRGPEAADELAARVGYRYSTGKYTWTKGQKDSPSL